MPPTGIEIAALVVGGLAAAGASTTAGLQAEEAKKGRRRQKSLADDQRKRETSQLESVRRRQLSGAANRQGRGSTILTGGVGLQDEPALSKATLLGG